MLTLYERCNLRSVFTICFISTQYLTIKIKKKVNRKEQNFFQENFSKLNYSEIHD